MKMLEANVPTHLRVAVCYLYEGRASKNQLKKIGKTNTKYVTIAKLISKATGSVRATGIAACSTKEAPTRAVGRAVAVGRALASYEGETA